MISKLFPTSLLALACVASIASTAAARTAYDGSWSVLIMTHSGTCDRAHRSGVRIVDGYIVSDGGGINLRGQVSSSGSVRVNVSAGGQSASGSGRLSRNSGGGVWRGRGNSGVCAGRWQAERRG